MVVKLRKGLDLPLSGEPEQSRIEVKEVGRVALLGADAMGLRPSMMVREGERVRLGQALFTDPSVPRLRYAAPGSGVVLAIERGVRRSLQSVVIELDGDDEETFAAYARSELPRLPREAVQENLLTSGLWTALRTRPFSKVPHPDSQPSAIFVNAMDTNPLAARPEVVVAGAREDFCDGVAAVSRLTDGPVFLCRAPGADIPVPAEGGIRVAEFAGPHPAGLVGTHVHFLHPVNAQRTVWHLNYQDAIAIGRLFTTGRLAVERILSLGGPVVKRPRLLRTRIGADLMELVRGELEEVESRVVSGSVLAGHRAAGPMAFLGRYHLQVSVLAEGREREFLGWLSPGLHRFSATNAYLSSLLGGRRRLALSTSQNGSPRAIIPVESYRKVMPLRVLPAPLLRALVVGDTDTARELGCLELDEEDLALCSFVCPSKYDYGPALRETLEQIDREG